MIDAIIKDGAISFGVRVVPRASRNEIVGAHDGALKVRITSPPVDGAANAELIKTVAKAFGTAKSNVEIVAGESSKSKRVCIRGIDAAAAKAILNAIS